MLAASNLRCYRTKRVIIASEPETAVGKALHLCLGHNLMAQRFARFGRIEGLKTTNKIGCSAREKMDLAGIRAVIWEAG